MRNNEDRVGTNLSKQDGTPIEQLANTEASRSPSLDFMIPTELVSLPSKGKFYRTGHPLHNKDVIEIKQMTAKEEDILTSRNLLKKGVALDKLIQALVLDKNINTDTLTIEDRNAIIVAARISAYGAKYTTTVSCPSCNEKLKHTFDLNEKLEKATDESRIELQFDENGHFAVELPASKWKVVCRVLNGYDEKELARLAETKKKNTNGSESTLVDQLKMMIVSFLGHTDKALIEKVAESMPAADSKYLRKVYNDNVPNVDLNHNFACKSCDFETEMEVPLTADFFWFK